MSFSIPDFNMLKHKIIPEIEKRKELMQNIESDLADDLVDKEEARYEASLRFLELVHMAVVDLKNLQEFIEDNGVSCQDKPEILCLARDWLERSKKYYKSKSDFYFFLKYEHKEKSDYLRKEMDEIESRLKLLPLE